MKLIIEGFFSNLASKIKRTSYADAKQSVDNYNKVATVINDMTHELQTMGYSNNDIRKMQKYFALEKPNDGSSSLSADNSNLFKSAMTKKLASDQIDFIAKLSTLGKVDAETYKSLAKTDNTDQMKALYYAITELKMDPNLFINGNKVASANTIINRISNMQKADEKEKGVVTSSDVRDVLKTKGYDTSVLKTLPRDIDDDAIAQALYARTIGLSNDQVSRAVKDNREDVGAALQQLIKNSKGYETFEFPNDLSIKKLAKNTASKIRTDFKRMTKKEDPKVTQQAGDENATVNLQ